MIGQFSKPTVVIVGGGLSGTLVAANLMRRARAPLRIVIVERCGPVGPGVAYSTRNPEHLLNVAAGRMSAWPDEPNDFVAWVRSQKGQSDVPSRFSSDDFLPRCLFGRYIQDALASARSHTGGDLEFEEIPADAVDLEEIEQGAARLLLSNGQIIEADQVVLALGNLPGEYPIQRPLPIYATDRYVHVPWRADALANLNSTDDVLLVGQGLTAADLIVQLAHQGHRGTIHALSRHGLTPQPHVHSAPYPAFLRDMDAPLSIRALVRKVRDEIRSAVAKGLDWRAVIDAIRPDASAIWQALSWGERSRFMRHVRAIWEVHRHRVAPQVHERLTRLADTGTLKLHAGRLQTLDVDGDAVHALVRHRGSIKHTLLRVARVVNCTGPRTDYSKYQHPLLVHLLARGLIDHDPLALGINALPNGQILRYRGGPNEWLWTLGAPLKGMLWETTAVPEIRVQAKALADALLERCGALSFV